LANPSLIKDNDDLKKFFEKEKAQIKITDEFELECLISSDKEFGFRYIDRKHSKGNNQVGWGDTERANYNKRRGKAKKDELLKIALAKIIKDLDLPELAKEQVLGRGFVTTFYRIVTSSSAWQTFGYDLSESGDLKCSDPDFKDKLKVIILNVLNKQDFNGSKIDSRYLNKNKAIEGYLQSVKKEEIQKIESEIQKNTTEDMYGEKRFSTQKTSSTRCNPKSTSRLYLIPKTCIFQISEPKINNIYRELRDDLLLDDSNRAVPNAVGVLFRVFLEISLDYLLHKEGQDPGPNDTINVKITKVVNILKDKGGVEEAQLKAINKVGSSTNSSTNSDLLSIENFHQYVHSYKEQPTSSALKLKWDNLQEFFELLWKYINTSSSKKKI